MSYCPVCADLLREKQELEARVRELEAREEVLQRALSRWLPQIAGDDERGPMYAAASEDSMLLMGLCDETAESEWYGQHILQRAEAAEALASQIRTDWLPANERLAARAEQAEAALSVVRQLPEKWRERKPGAGRMSDLSNVVRKTCADELSAAIAHGGAGEGEKNG